jgi:hypothetical protein
MAVLFLGCGSNSINTAVYLVIYLSVRHSQISSQVSTKPLLSWRLAAGSCVQTTVHVYTEYTELFSLAQTHLVDFEPDYPARNKNGTGIPVPVNRKWNGFREFRFRLIRTGYDV